MLVLSLYCLLRLVLLSCFDVTVFVCSYMFTYTYRLPVSTPSFPFVSSSNHNLEGQGGGVPLTHLNNNRLMRGLSSNSTTDFCCVLQVRNIYLHCSKTVDYRNGSKHDIHKLHCFFCFFHNWNWINEYKLNKTRTVCFDFKIAHSISHVFWSML